MKNIVLLIISGILIICSISLLFSRILIPIKKNKDIVDNRIYYGDIKDNLETSKPSENTEPVKLEATDSNVVSVYVGNFMNKVNFGKYEEAYGMLSQSFKNTNFKTAEEFENFWKQKYNDFLVVEYVSMERMGDYILVKVNLNDRMHKKDTIEQIFTVVKEDKEYKISFGLGE